ncbi:MAG: lipopolysaccharide transport periplasmic protein LptA [Helicobacter sp.]|uniref:lipopolysaccharide transport periplasmic protein LptA n=1 Tax=Helicobacter sp. TaxID=218 RepID=UPI0023BF197D|nr:lipopolysaccharide transport periplasmic protein LptA [Helicobacter sp.]MDE5925758.1 lipopolysaccharide transport periplasmic protein LptA [Helicobacter sp.]MDE7175167.1 lipopolysaccharide transport periplasmic protein LptA [Helicobacter sp.]
MKKLFKVLLLLLIPFVWAEEIEVSAKELIGDERRKLTQLKGNVEVKRAKDNLKADEAFIYLDSNNRPNKMQAIGNVRFWLTLQDGRRIEGRANEALYLPSNQEYQILGNAVVKEITKNNVVRGDKIIIRYKEGFINVLGNEEKPARLIFKLEKEPK